MIQELLLTLNHAIDHQMFLLLFQTLFFYFQLLWLLEHFLFIDLWDIAIELGMYLYYLLILLWSSFIWIIEIWDHRRLLINWNYTDWIYSSLIELAWRIQVARWYDRLVMILSWWTKRTLLFFRRSCWYTTW